MTAVNPVVGIEVSDGRLDLLPSFEQLSLFISQPFNFAPMFDLYVRELLVHAPVTQVGKQGLGLDAQALHQADILLYLLIYRVPVIRVAGDTTSTQDQIDLDRHGQAHPHPKLIGIAAFDLADALSPKSMPAAELGAVAPLCGWPSERPGV